MAEHPLSSSSLWQSQWHIKRSRDATTKARLFSRTTSPLRCARLKWNVKLIRPGPKSMGTECPDLPGTGGASGTLVDCRRMLRCHALPRGVGRTQCSAAISLPPLQQELVGIALPAACFGAQRAYHRQNVARWGRQLHESHAGTCSPSVREGTVPRTDSNRYSASTDSNRYPVSLASWTQVAVGHSPRLRRPRRRVHQ